MLPFGNLPTQGLYPLFRTLSEKTLEPIRPYNPTSDPLTTFRPSRVITFVEYGCKYKGKDLYICVDHFFLKGFSHFLPSGYSGEALVSPLFSIAVVCTLFNLSGIPQKNFLTSWRCERGGLLQLTPRSVIAVQRPA